MIVLFLEKVTSLELFLRPLVNELLAVIPDGILINNKTIAVKIRAFLADSPARSFIKGEHF